jgi:cytochrome c-type biogenesis protein CcmF
MAQRGDIRVTYAGKEVARMAPEKRRYSSQGSPMTEAAIDAGLTRDLYVALGEPLQGGAWSVRVYHKPFVQWIWLGPLLMGLGGLTAVADRRYRMRSRLRTREGAAVSGAVPAKGSA